MFNVQQLHALEANGTVFRDDTTGNLATTIWSQTTQGPRPDRDRKRDQHSIHTQCP
jgi:hypothetical protein